MNYQFRRSYTGPLKAAVLDWAGTTVDYGCCAPAVVFIDVFKKRGVEITQAEAREPMGAAKRQHIKEISEMPRVTAAWKSVHGTPCTEADIDAMYAEFIPMQIGVLKDYSELIPGTLETVRHFRQRGMKIGTTTGYSREMIDVVTPIAAKAGYTPDSVVSASEVPSGRPGPWMALHSLMEMNVFPLEAVVKIGDTVPDILEGINGGMWSVGVTKAGNEIGLTEAEVLALAPDDLARRLEKATHKLAAAGAHYVVESIGDIPAVLDAIEARLARGERP